MPSVRSRINTPADRQPQIHAGKPVNIRLTKGGTHHAITGETESAAIARGVSRSITLWVEGRVAQDRFRLEMCYAPVFDDDGNLDPASKWAQLGEIVELSATGGLVAAQTLNDLGHAFRVVRVNNTGAPTAGDFDVYVWALNG